MQYIKITHGSQIHSILEDELSHKMLITAANEGEFIFTEKYDIKDTDGSLYNTPMVIRKYELGPFSFLTISALSKDEKKYELKSFYPYINEGHGTEIEVEIMDIMEDEEYNFEGVIGCSFDGKQFYFLDPFYYKNKDKYEVGKKCRVEISGLLYQIGGLTKEEAEFEVNRTLEQRQQMGVEIEYDEDGNLKPIIMNTTKMNSFIPSHEWYGDIQFQCKMKEQGKFDYCGEKIYAIGLEIQKENGDKIPFISFTRESNITNKETFGDGMPVRGVFMLQGILCE